MANYNESDGVWRTVGGRRIFIRDGQSLSDAMKSSGKFKNKRYAKDVKSKTMDQYIEDHNKKIEDIDNDSKLEEFMKKDTSYDDFVEKYFDGDMQDAGEFLDKYQEKIADKYFDGDMQDAGEAIAKKVGVAISVKEAEEAYLKSGLKKGSSKEFDREKFNKWSNENSDKNIKEYEKETGRDALHLNGDPTKDFSDYEKERYNQLRDKNYQDYMSGKKDWEGYQKGIQEANKKQQGVQKLKDKLNGNDKEKYSEKQLEMVWENEDATEVYDHLSRGELNKLNQATKDMETTTPGTPGYENARQYVQEMEDKAATKFLNAHREDPDYEGYFMSDEYVAGENKKADIRNQKLDIEDATGIKVKDAFETDLYGGGKEDRFALEDGRMVTHTTESFGQEDDTWAVFDKGMKNQKVYKSYDEMMKDLGGKKVEDDLVWNRERMLNEKIGSTEGRSNLQAKANKLVESKKSSEPKTFFDGKRDIEAEARQIYAEDGSRATSDRNIEYLAKKYDIPKTQARSFMEDTMKKFDDDNRKANVANGYYKKAFQEYKKKHPNTKLNLNQFIDMSEGK